jgi:flagellar basal body-associated protein FliL
MADKEQKKPEAAADAKGKEEGKSGGGLLTKTPVLLGAVMVIEAVVLFAGLKMLGFGATKETVAAELVTDEHAEGEHADEKHEGSDEKGGKDDHAADEKKEGAEKGKDGAPVSRKPGKKEQVEIQVVELRAPNKQTGRTFLYDLSIFVVTRGEHVDKINKTLKDREALIKDRIRTIIAQSDPEKLGGGSEPGLETLRRQVKHQLDEIVGEGLIEEVLVPRCIPFRTDY